MVLGRILIVLVVLISSVAPVFSRELQGLGWNALQTSAIRGLVGAVIIGIIFNKRIAEAGKDIKGVISASFSVLFAQTCYIYAVQHASMGLVISLLYLGPVWVVLYERLFLKIRNKKDVIACIFGFLGTLLVATGFNWHERTELWGIIVAFAGSLSYMWFVLSVKKATTKVPPEIIAFWGLVAVSITLGWTLFGANWSAISLKYSLAFGVINGATYFVIYFIAIKLLPSASEAGVWCYLEVAIVWLIGIMVYHEAMRPISLLGTASIVVAGLILARRAKT